MTQEQLETMAAGPPQLVTEAFVRGYLHRADMLKIDAIRFASFKERCAAAFRRFPITLGVL